MCSDVRDGFIGSITNIEILVYIELLVASLIEYNMQEMLNTVYGSAVICSLCRAVFLSLVLNRTDCHFDHPVADSQIWCQLIGTGVLAQGNCVAGTLEQSRDAIERPSSRNCLLMKCGTARR